MATSSSVPFEEGPVILRTPRGLWVPPLRRGDTTMKMGVRNLPRIALNEAAIETVQESLSSLAKARSSTRELDGILWLFGRCCNASLSRDVVLDAVIALEMMLVPTPGESRYRFGLHGAVLIEDESSDVLERDLKKLYALRSEAAHGAASSDKQFSEMAARSRVLLAKAIQHGQSRSNQQASSISMLLEAILGRRWSA